MHLARQCFGGRGQGMRAGARYLGATLFDHRVIAIPHRVRHYHERQIIVADALRRHLRQRRERRAHHGDRGNAQHFEFSRVTRGPRG